MIKIFLKPIALMLAAAIAVIVMISVFGANKRISDDANRGESDFSAAVNIGEKRPYCVFIAGSDAASGLSDVMMLAAFDRSEETACILQIPRDTYAEYGNGYFKINGIIQALGADGACDFFERSFGVEIDGYISLDLKGFRAAVDAIGGVEMTLDKSFKYSDPAQNLYIDIPSGKQVLDGERAEMLVRYRSGYARGDLDRLDMQKRFLAAFFVALREKTNPLNIYRIASSVLPYLKTDIAPNELVSLGIKLLSLDGERACMVTLPGEDVISEISGGSFYVASKQGTAELLAERFGGDINFFDREELLLHPSLDSFKKIYRKKIDARLVFLSELK